LRYFGSKASVVGDVLREVSASVPSGSICDPFGGIGVIGAAFKEAGYSVYSGDHLVFPYLYQAARLGLSRPPAFQGLSRHLRLHSASEVAAHLNGVGGHAGWITSQYSRERAFFSLENAMLIDGCRAAIEEWASSRWITRTERGFLIASLIDSADRVANTAGTYYAYLKTLTRRAAHRFVFTLLVPVPGRSAQISLGDALTLVGRRRYEVVYLDPPYNERRYGGYYHLPESIARGTTPAVSGRAGVPVEPWPSSSFNHPREATEALRRLIEAADCRLLAVHYARDGIVATAEIEGMLSAWGNLKTVELTALGYTSRPEKRAKRHMLYLAQHA